MSSVINPAPLMTRLNLEWTNVLASREHEFGRLGTRDCAELLTTIRASKGAAQDALLYELIVLAREGDRIAERVLVQVLIPAAQRMAHRVRSLGDMDRADRVGYAIGRAWEMIGRYNLHLKEKVHGNLTMGLLGLLSPTKTQNDVNVADRTTAVSDDMLEVVAGQWQEPDLPMEVLAARLFTWATDTGVLTSDETALLARVALGDEKQTEIAADLSVTVDCVNKRVARSRRRLWVAYQQREQL
ncbi:hypothetical protein [Microbacterium testaceum]|uniref:hypothetical protein n=1 Tax=Microbacterium testaceum TaxID=2033 RepID=UPI002AC7DA38|nr:hypothetical protein [Microbacterium testaceum]MDZ5146354.1 hypothetical protein [Microbacterium testaceum]